MSGFRVRGVLDRPSQQSLGMLGIVVERESGLHCVEGIVGMSAKPIDGSEFRELLKSGDAQSADVAFVDDDSRPYSALWVGQEFADNATRLKVPLPPLPNLATSTGEGGVYWVGPTQHVWRVLDSWLVRAFRRSIRENNVELATLMAWALPERQETRAAIWHTNKGDRKANLGWWARLDRDHGEPKVTPRELDIRYAKLVSDVLSQTPQRVFGFCAWAKGGDNEIATELSQRLHVRQISFGKWLRKKAEKEGDQPIRRVLQRKGQRMIETHGALEFCLEVLSDNLPQNASIPNVRFVIDGIRHAEVLRSLQSLIGEDHFTLVHIERSEAVRRKLLIEEEHVSADEVDEVMSDSTEQEIPGVAILAARTYQREAGVRQIAMELASIK
ncbi:hypothetical protein AYO44_05015 [Planctomycetaceae bacterium SCGC AG-212-F19]|nr:hypothetical protein AYO44_05015 [Planctomycetaceae bacterium SCGC AG-212-F19]